MEEGNFVLCGRTSLELNCKQFNVAFFYHEKCLKDYLASHFHCIFSLYTLYDDDSHMRETFNESRVKINHSSSRVCNGGEIFFCLIINFENDIVEERFYSHRKQIENYHNGAPAIAIYI